MNEVGKIFIFIGPPGAGKGTLAHFCTKNFGWLQVSTGNLCRKHIAEQTKIGKEIDLIIKTGKLINDQLITNMVVDWLQEHGKKALGIIFDGYPRTLVQATEFTKILRAIFPHFQQRVVSFFASDEKVINRLCQRFVCQNKECEAIYSAAALQNDSILTMTCSECGSLIGRRSDDEQKSIEKRLAVYYKHEKELIGFYRQSGVECVELNAEQSFDNVLNNFLRTLDE